MGLAIDLASLNDVDFIGIAQDLKVVVSIAASGHVMEAACYCTHPLPHKISKMIASEWILCRNRFPTKHSSNAAGVAPGMMRSKRGRG